MVVYGYSCKYSSCIVGVRYIVDYILRVSLREARYYTLMGSIVVTTWQNRRDIQAASES